MRVFKFGGASVKDAEGIRNLARIVRGETDDLAVVVSAMGKTTNALERVVNALWLREQEQVEREWALIEEYHRGVADELGVTLDLRFPETQATMDSYDELYDQVVSWGELMSTRLVSAYLTKAGIRNEWLDMTRLLITDATFRAAQVDFPATEDNLLAHFAYRPGAEYANRARVRVLQGFIGGTADGRRTTLGREGSDYTAALVAAALNAESVTIWKDVPGILTADPRKDKSATLIPELSYEDAERLAASGAQIIHRKTIFPLERKQIPLYVKPFLQPDAPGSVIRNTKLKLSVPVNWGK